MEEPALLSDVVVVGTGKAALTAAVAAGEASTAPVAAALANAIFDATGVRLRAMPFTPDWVKAALTASAGRGAPARSTPDASRH